MVTAIGNIFLIYVKIRAHFTTGQPYSLSSGGLTIVVIVLVLIAVVMVVIMRNRSDAAGGAKMSHVDPALKTHIAFNRSLDSDVITTEADNDDDDEDRDNGGGGDVGRGEGQPELDAGEMDLLVLVQPKRF